MYDTLGCPFTSTFEHPKSHSRHLSVVGSQSRLSGLMSRWQMRRAWMYSSARNVCHRYARMWSTAKRFRRLWCWRATERIVSGKKSITRWR